MLALQQTRSSLIYLSIHVYASQVAITTSLSRSCYHHVDSACQLAQMVGSSHPANDSSQGQKLTNRLRLYRLDENSHLLKPPINNYCVWNEDFTVMVILFSPPKRPPHYGFLHPFFILPCPLTAMRPCVPSRLSAAPTQEQITTSTRRQSGSTSIKVP